MQRLEASGLGCGRRHFAVTAAALALRRDPVGVVPSSLSRCPLAQIPGGLWSAHNPFSVALTLALSFPDLEETEEYSVFQITNLSWASILLNLLLGKPDLLGRVIHITSPWITNILTVLLFKVLSVFCPWQKAPFCFLFSVSETSFYCQTCTQGFKKACYLKDWRQGWAARLSHGTDLHLLHKKQKAAQWGDGASRADSQSSSHHGQTDCPGTAAAAVNGEVKAAAMETRGGHREKWEVGNAPSLPRSFRWWLKGPTEIPKDIRVNNSEINRIVHSK